MRVFVTGVKGQLGHDVMNELAKRGHEGIGVDIEEMDITDAESVRKSHYRSKPGCRNPLCSMDRCRPC